MGEVKDFVVHPMAVQAPCLAVRLERCSLGHVKAGSSCQHKSCFQVAWGAISCTIKKGCEWESLSFISPRPVRRHAGTIRSVPHIRGSFTTVLCWSRHSSHVCTNKQVGCWWVWAGSDKQVQVDQVWERAVSCERTASLRDKKAQMTCLRVFTTSSNL